MAFEMLLHVDLKFKTLCILANQEKVRTFHSYYFFKKGHPGICFIYFRLFKQTLQILQQIYVEKCYVNPV